MIASLEGTLARLGMLDAVVVVNGVGYEVAIPLSTRDKMPAEGRRVLLHTHLASGEAGMSLYGFATAAEKDLFRLLIGVSGVGPKLALNVLSGLPVANFIDAVASGDVKALSRVNGIGRKTAERLILELRDKVAALPAAASEGRPRERALEDAYLALVQLGFKPDAARAAAQAAWDAAPAKERTTEAIIRSALGALSG